MPNIERRYGNSMTMERKNKNWKRRSKEKTNKEKIWNSTVGVHDMSEISGTGLGKYDTNPYKKNGKGKQRNSQEEKKTGNNWPRIGKTWWPMDREDNWKLIGRNNAGKPEERTLEKKNRKNDQDDRKCGLYDIWKWKMIEEKFWKYESCKWK